MTDPFPRVVTENGEIDLLVVAGVLLRYWWLIACCVVGAASLAILYSLTATRWYQAEVSIVQVDADGLGSALGGLGALGTITGIGAELGGSEGKIPMAVLQSRDLAQEFVSGQQLVSELYKGAASSLVARLLPPDREQWTLREATQFFDQAVRSVDNDSKSGITKLVITWIDPDAAASWANLFVLHANDTLRAQAIAEAQRNIDYLNGELRQATMPVIQQSLSKVLESEIRKKLLAQGGREYAFRVVDRAEPPQEKVRPATMLPLLAACMIGALLGSAIALLRYRRVSLRTRK